MARSHEYREPNPGADRPGAWEAYRYVAGEMAPDEEAAFEEWLERDPECGRHVACVVALWETSARRHTARHGSKTSGRTAWMAHGGWAIGLAAGLFLLAWFGGAGIALWQPGRVPDQIGETRLADAWVTAGSWLRQDRRALAEAGEFVNDLFANDWFANDAAGHEALRATPLQENEGAEFPPAPSGVLGAAADADVEIPRVAASAAGSGAEAEEVGMDPERSGLPNWLLTAVQEADETPVPPSPSLP